ncbi:MAG TPA: ABC transporter permease [Verrucomicrobiae bacterium]|nr:ABC transporter permease [Verrucomicrobiae bacterium]
MRLLATLRIAWRALRRNPLRTVLTALGVIIGVGAVIAMVSIGTGAKVQVEAQIASLGQNVILVMAGGVTRGGVFSGMGGAGTLKIEDAEAIRNEVEGVACVSPEVRVSAQVTAGNANWNTSIYGESEEYFDLRRWPIEDGSGFGAADVRSGNRVAVLGKTVVKELFGETSPVGQTIRIRGVPFVVSGVLSSKGSNFFGQDQDDAVIVPYTTAMRRLFGITALRSIQISAAGESLVQPVLDQTTALLRQRHRIPEGRDDDFHVHTQQELAEMATSTAKIMTTLLGSIAGVSLLVGGIGIMNIMLVSVTERTREIGIRLAVGAKRRDILMQFLIEAVTLSVGGGIVGVLMGLAASVVIARQMKWPTQTPLESVVLAFLFSAAVGIFFGFYPARRASRLDPIEALRYE